MSSDWGGVNTHTLSVSKGSVEGLCVGEEQVLDVCEAFDLELLRLFLYDLSNKGKTEKVTVRLNL